VDNDYSVDIEDVIGTLQTSDVVVIRFIALGMRLLLDFRATEIDGPLVRLVQPVTSVEERYKDLARMRPRLAPPEKIVAVMWTRFAPSLRTTGVWDVVMRRIADAGHADAARRAEEALAELVAAEAEEQRRAVKGEGFRTVWSASPAPR
jgi:hypothetical protein